MRASPMPFRFLFLVLAVLWWGALPSSGQGPFPSGSFAVDPEKSRVEVLLFRAGPFKGFASDHLLLARGFSGRIGLNAAGLPATSVEIAFPVSLLEVDPPEARAREGLKGVVSAADRKSVRETMLGPEQLDADRFPEITATAEGVLGVLPNPTLRLSLRIKDVRRTLLVPVTVSFSGETLRAEGELRLNQTDFGIEPFSFLLGAVSVEDEVRVRFIIVARRER